MMHRLLGAAAAVCAVAAFLTWSGDARPAVVTVDLHHSAFVPGAIEVRAGQQVRFVVRNTDPIDHEFLIGDDATQARHEAGTEPTHGDRPGEISVPAGETRTTTFTFTSPGDMLIGCHLPGHWDAGMRGVILVT